MLVSLFAAILSGLWAGVHTFVGGRECERPLAADETLAPVVRETMRMCWHMITGVLILMAVFFAAAYFEVAGFALAGTALALVFVVAGVGFAPLNGLSYRLVPQGWLFVPVLALGLWGLVG